MNGEKYDNRKRNAENAGIYAGTDENGYQRVQKDVPEVKIESYDLRTCSEDEQLLNLQNIRANYAEKQYPLGQWPMCDIVLSLWKGKSIIHFSLDMLITDFMSANLILNDLDNYYHGNYYKSCDCIKCSSCSNENAGFLYG